MRRPIRGGLEYHLLVVVTLGLVAFGLVMVYSASSARAALAADDPAYYLKRQAAYAFLGLVALAVLSRFDYRRLRYLVPPLLLGSFALLLAVLVARDAGERGQALAHLRPGDDPALRARQARARALGGGVPLALAARRARSASSSARSGSSSAPPSR